jgi:hypothetical protein
MVALRRGSEVILGALVGWAFHWAAETLVDAITGAASGRGATRQAHGWSARHQGTRRVEG